MASDPANFPMLLSSRLDGVPDDGDGAAKEDKPGDKHEQMKSSAMAAFIAAVHSKDTQGAKESLSDYLELCEDDDKSEDSGDDGDIDLDSDMGDEPDAAA